MAGKKRIKKKKQKMDNTNRNREVVALFFVLVAFICAYAVIVPESSGIAGKAFSHVMFQMFGTGTYILPCILLWFFIVHVSKSMELREKTDFMWSAACMASGAVLFSFSAVLFETDTHRD